LVLTLDQVVLVVVELVALRISPQNQEQQILAAVVVETAEAQPLLVETVALE
jgi:hypothetical protein